MLIDSWQCLKGLKADAIVTIESPVRDDDWERVNRYVAQSRAKHLLSVVDFAQQNSVT